MAAPDTAGLLKHVAVNESASPTTTHNSENSSTFQAGKAQALINLRNFQAAVGIGTPSHIATPLDLPGDDAASTASPPKPGDGSTLIKCQLKRNRAAENEGIYARVVDLQRRTRWSYLFFSTVMNICFLAQIAIAAILTALGASTAPHNVITVFGAINTAFAGLLALLKGQGLPERLRQDWVGLTNVRDFIEERERFLEQGFYMDTALDTNGKHKVDVQSEVEKVLELYESQLATIEANRPDNYAFTGAGKKTRTTPQPNFGPAAGKSAVSE
jgi:hypothetical protein